MKTYLTTLLFASLLVSGCSVMTPAVEKAAITAPPFEELLAHPERHIGQTAIMGGYILEVFVQTDQTRVVVVQSPLGTGREPRSQDLSQGRIIAVYKGFLDPEVYAKGRKVTLAGKISGGSGMDPQPEPFPYVRLDVAEVYLWPRKTIIHDPYYWPPYWYDPWWGGYPYPWHWHSPRIKHRR